MTKNHMLHSHLKALMALFLLLTLLGGPAIASPAPGTVTFEDSLGRTVTVPEDPQRVVSLIGSFAEAYALAGGTLVGTTDDAITERQLDLGADVQVIGTLHSPSMELVLSLSPDLVLLSTEISAHRDAGQVLENAGIAHAYFTVMTAADYMNMMAALCAVTGRADLLAAQEETVAAPIAAMVEAARAQPDYGQRTALFLRAYSTGVKAKGSDSLAGAILRDMGLVNLADGDGLLEDITMEAVIAADPDYVFVVTMGSDEQKALDALQSHLTGNPAWAGLTAVREDRFILLPKALFNNKPNDRWAEAYAIIQALLYEA